MLRLEANRGVSSCDGLSRREFLRVGGLALGLSLTELAQANTPHREKSCIQLFLVGGPSQLDTWDLKPDAPTSMRGPFQPMATNVPGIHICEHFPRMARLADRYAILRSIHHEEAPIHETGQQLLQTGRLVHGDLEWPHCGAVLSKVRPAAQTPSWVVLPRPLGNTGVNVSHGQTAGFLGAEHGPFIPNQDLCVADRSTRHGLDPARLDRRSALLDAVDDVQRLVEAGTPSPALASLFNRTTKRAFDLAAEPDHVRDRYGRNTFGQSCLLARRLVQHGVRLVTVNMFDTVFGQITWDCHANAGDLCSTLDDYRDILCPMLDQAYSALLEDLVNLGLLDDTLVVCVGEFGRTPKLNCRQGRDHWTGVWSGLLAGGGVQGGQVLGSSDADGAAPQDRPIHLSEIAATVYHALGVNPALPLPCPDGQTRPVTDARPLVELF